MREVTVTVGESNYTLDIPDNVENIEDYLSNFVDALGTEVGQEQPEPIAEVEEEVGEIGTYEPKTSLIENTLAGAGERVGDVIGNLGGLIDDGSRAISDAVGKDFRVGYNLRGKDSGWDAGTFTPEEIAKQGRVGKFTEDVMSNVDLGFESRYSVDSILESDGFVDGLENTLGFMFETGVISAVDKIGRAHV